MRKSKPFQMPERIWRAAEAKARERRRLTGEMVRWTDVIHEILAKRLIPQRRRTGRSKP